MGILSDEELASLRSEVALVAGQHRYTEWAQGVIEELIASHMALAASVEERRDWTGEEIEEAVWRLREAAAEDATGMMVKVEDLRMLLASAGGLADNYSILLEHTTGLTKPTTDARRILSLVDDRERERQDEAIAEAREDWAGLRGEGVTMRGAVAFTVGFVGASVVSGLLWNGWPGAIVLGVVAVVCFTGALLGELVAQKMRER